MVETALAEVEVADFRERNDDDLVGRRAAARALGAGAGAACMRGSHHGPGVLFLDEPTASLDLRHQLLVLRAARRRAEGGTAVVVDPA